MKELTILEVKNMGLGLGVYVGLAYICDMVVKFKHISLISFDNHVIIYLSYSIF